MTASDFINEKTFYDKDGRGMVFRDVAEEWCVMRMEEHTLIRDDVFKKEDLYELWRTLMPEVADDLFNEWFDAKYKKKKP